MVPVEQDNRIFCVAPNLTSKELRGGEFCVVKNSIGIRDIAEIGIFKSARVKNSQSVCIYAQEVLDD